ncbi:hypothetical protein RMSM_02067 [Rhodopirellula maiorica SM1]|uniref:Uncharacterized protein n=1 Tax=Rhodopirellula maiorica SM1 TaxID=1265738 RepID=M5S039_9BACT|nr:hypothetical protein [Rhodopirellula maiorica]EMI21022.1 hypothetical protein RMSM_02067 [Rhodopirellula maiorica SM1]
MRQPILASITRNEAPNTKPVVDHDRLDVDRLSIQCVSMLTRLILRLDGVAESKTEPNTGVEYKYEYRNAERRNPLLIRS